MKIEPDHKKTLVLYGPALVEDKELIIELEKYFFIIPCLRYENLGRILDNNVIAIILFQINSEGVQVTNLRQILSQYHKFPVIVLGNGKQMDIVAQAFNFGAGDFFRIPYRIDLLVERARFLAGDS